MKDALELLVRDVSHQTIVLDVDQDPALLNLYDELVPVLFARQANDPETAGAGSQLCHYFLDADKVKAFCHE
jgi:hypothetical protein